MTKPIGNFINAILKVLIGSSKVSHNSFYVRASLLVALHEESSKSSQDKKATKRDSFANALLANL